MMLIRRAVCIALAAAAAMLMLCSKEAVDHNPFAPPTYEGLPLTVTMTRCSYEALTADTLRITLPAQLVCDSSGEPVSSDDSTIAVWYYDSGHVLLLSLMNAVPLIRVITAGPGFSKDIGEFLDLLEGLPAWVTSGIRGRFEATLEDAGIQGQWWFSGIEPDVLYGFMDSTQQAALASLVTDANGNAGMLFEFTADTLIGLLSRRTYGDAALSQVVDTIGFDMRIVHESDSIWLVRANVTVDSVYVYINQTGDLAWSFGDSVYTYFLRPSGPQICPNRVGPLWLAPVVEANARQVSTTQLLF